MIKANHHFLWKKFFDVYIQHIIKKQFSKLYVDVNISIHPEFPLLVISNHSSWWDGFIIYQMNRYQWKKKFHVMMLEDELSQRKPLSYIGAYSVKKGTRSIINSMNYTVELMEEKDNMVLLFPQGSMFSQFDYPIEFESGLFSILKRINSPIQLVFCVMLTDYGPNKKPILSLYQTLYDEKIQSHDQLENAYNRFLDQTMKRHRFLNKGI